jgi:hypothetical protein
MSEVSGKETAANIQVLFQKTHSWEMGQILWAAHRITEDDQKSGEAVP